MRESDSRRVSILVFLSPSPGLPIDPVRNYDTDNPVAIGAAPTSADLPFLKNPRGQFDIASGLRAIFLVESGSLKDLVRHENNWAQRHRLAEQAVGVEVVEIV